MLTENHIREGLSRAFIFAVAHRAGLNCCLARSFDYGIDGELLDIKVSGGRHIDSGFSIEFQAKASGACSITATEVIYDLEVKTYHDLIDHNRPAWKPFILILLGLPVDPNEWLTVTSDALLLRRSAWWISLRGQPRSSSKSTQRIKIPKSNVFDVTTARLLMERTKRGEIL